MLARTDIPESDWIGNSAASQTELKKVQSPVALWVVMDALCCRVLK